MLYFKLICSFLSRRSSNIFSNSYNLQKQQGIESEEEDEDEARARNRDMPPSESESETDSEGEDVSIYEAILNPIQYIDQPIILLTSRFPAH